MATTNISKTIAAAVRGAAAAVGLALAIGAVTSPVAADEKATKIKISTGEYKFGPHHDDRRIALVRARNANGEQMFIGHRVTFNWFILPYGVSDGGYVLTSKDGSNARRLEPALRDVLQKQGLLPTPLPAYEMSFVDRLLGNALWIVLLLVTAWRTRVELAKRGIKLPSLSLPKIPDGISLPQWRQSLVPAAADTAPAATASLTSTLRPVLVSTAPVRASAPVPVAAKPAPMPQPATADDEDMDLFPTVATAPEAPRRPTAEIVALPAARVVCRIKQKQAAA